MNSNTRFDFILTDEFQKFAKEHSAADPVMLRLKDLSQLPFDKELAIIQLECRKKAKRKIPELAEQLAYPTAVSIEQCTSSILAEFHASLFETDDNVIDLTCGLGIDTFFIAQKAQTVTSVEANDIVAEAAGFNYNRLGRSNISVVCDTAEHFISTHSGELKANAVFVDPSRRLTQDRNLRTYSIKDTTPDVALMLPEIRRFADFMIVKASPMVDISQTIADFPDISDVWILSVKNECKELLFRIDFRTKKEIEIHTLNFDSLHTQIFSYTYGATASPMISSHIGQGHTLCVPNASVMKAGAYNLAAQAFGLRKIAANSHLLFAEKGQPDSFPGRQFEVIDILSLSKPDVKKLKSITGCANIACRNFPLTPEELRKKLRIGDGGEYYIFATTTADAKKILLLCKPQQPTA